MAFTDTLSSFSKTIISTNPITLIVIIVAIIVVLFVYMAYRSKQASTAAALAATKKPSFWQNKSVTEILVVAILALIFIQLVGWILPEILSPLGVHMEQIKVGPLFLLLTIGAGVALIYKLVISADKQMKTEDWIGIGLIVIFVVALIVLLPKVVPQVFSVAAEKMSQTIITQTQSVLQSIIGA